MWQKGMKKENFKIDKLDFTKLKTFLPKPNIQTTNWEMCLKTYSS